MFKGIWDDVRSRGRESLETMGEGVGAAIVGLIGGGDSNAPPANHAAPGTEGPASVGENGQGGSMAYLPVHPLQMPEWIKPAAFAGFGLIGVMTIALMIRGAR